MIYLIIYLIGFVATWIVLKWWRNKNLDVYTEWIDILASFLFSLFSWLGFTICVIVILIQLLNENNVPKPPKWL